MDIILVIIISNLMLKEEMSLVYTPTPCGWRHKDRGKSYESKLIRCFNNKGSKVVVISSF